jgi:hypothetical protein
MSRTIFSEDEICFTGTPLEWAKANPNKTIIDYAKEIGGIALSYQSLIKRDNPLLYMTYNDLVDTGIVEDLWRRGVKPVLSHMRKDGTIFLPGKMNEIAVRRKVEADLREHDATMGYTESSYDHVEEVRRIVRQRMRKKPRDIIIVTGSELKEAREKIEEYFDRKKEKPTYLKMLEIAKREETFMRAKGELNAAQTRAMRAQRVLDTVIYKDSSIVKAAELERDRTQRLACMQADALNASQLQEKLTHPELSFEKNIDATQTSSSVMGILEYGKNDHPLCNGK